MKLRVMFLLIIIILFSVVGCDENILDDNASKRIKNNQQQDKFGELEHSKAQTENTSRKADENLKREQEKTRKMQDELEQKIRSLGNTLSAGTQEIKTAEEKLVNDLMEIEKKQADLKINAIQQILSFIEDIEGKDKDIKSKALTTLSKSNKLHNVVLDHFNDKTKITEEILNMLDMVEISTIQSQIALMLAEAYE